MADIYRFDRFLLSASGRRLSRDGKTVDLGGRYLDALIVMVSSPDQLITKERFMAEVWHGIPVTDEALTQCIRALRKALDDDAARPRFIETVPRHGYRFVAPVTTAASALKSLRRASFDPVAVWETVSRSACAGLIGGGSAGLIGGLAYGLLGVTDPLQPGGGAASAVLVLTGLTMMVGLLGGAGTGFGVGMAFARGSRPLEIILGGVLGGLIVGGGVKLVGTDALQLLFGRSPGDVTGSVEGALLGAGIGISVWLAGRWAASIRRAVGLGGLITGTAGAVAVLAGGRLMGGSLDLLSRAFPDSGLQLDRLGRLFGEAGFNFASQIATAAAEGALFGACVVAAIILSQPRGPTQRKAS